MRRECSLAEISDGKTYGLNDMVRADTGNCENCHKCCEGMGSSIVLDPYDVCLMKHHLGKSFEELLGMGGIELNMVDGLILPNLRMGEKDRCAFLNSELRCSIHSFRPGICRLFPLGRVYDGTHFQYFLQKDECVKKNRTKVKVKKWIDTEHIPENQSFIAKWHYFIREIGDKMTNLRDSGKGDRIKEVAMYVLNEFYVADLDTKLDELLLYELLERKIDEVKENIRKIS